MAVCDGDMVDEGVPTFDGDCEADGVDDCVTVDTCVPD